MAPTPSPGPAAAEPGTGPEAGQVAPPGAGLDARYEHLRHAALHARAEAFPLGLAVLTRKGVTAWRHALTDLTGRVAASVAGPVPMPAAALPTGLAAELVDALAGLALAGTRPPSTAIP